MIPTKTIEELISKHSALEKEFGRYVANNQTISGIYKMEIKNNKTFDKALKISNKFAEKEGREGREHGTC